MCSFSFFSAVTLGHKLEAASDTDNPLVLSSETMLQLLPQTLAELLSLDVFFLFFF